MRCVRGPAWGPACCERGGARPARGMHASNSQRAGRRGRRKARRPSGCVVVFYTNPVQLPAPLSNHVPPLRYSCVWGPSRALPGRQRHPPVPENDVFRPCGPGDTESRAWWRPTPLRPHTTPRAAATCHTRPAHTTGAHAGCADHHDDARLRQQTPYFISARSPLCHSQGTPPPNPSRRTAWW